MPEPRCTSCGCHSEKLTPTRGWEPDPEPAQLLCPPCGRLFWAAYNEAAMDYWRVKHGLRQPAASMR